MGNALSELKKCCKIERFIYIGRFVPIRLFIIPTVLLTSTNATLFYLQSVDHEYDLKGRTFFIATFSERVLNYLGICANNLRFIEVV